MPLRVQTIWREPLLHFVLIGAALFLYYDFVGRGETEAPVPKHIVVSSGQVEQLASNFERTWTRPPTLEELDAMVEGHVREEVLYREALAMGLDQNDPMVRRRMRMKLEFMLEDLSGQDADDGVLSDFLKQHPDSFREEVQLTLHQVFLNPDNRPDLENDVGRLLSSLNNGIAPEMLGDQTLAPRTYQLAQQSEIARDFGDEFARQVVSLTVGDWNGPVYSPYGAHLVKIETRVDARLPELVEVREEVLREYLKEKREDQKNLAYEKLREGYEVVVEPLKSGTISVLSNALASETR